MKHWKTQLKKLKKAENQKNSDRIVYREIFAEGFGKDIDFNVRVGYSEGNNPVDFHLYPYDFPDED